MTPSHTHSRSFVGILSLIITLYSVFLTTAAATPLLQLVKRDESTSPTTSYIRATTPAGSIFAVVLMVTGLAFTFFGRRLLKLAMFMAGFYVGAVIAFVACNAITPQPAEWIYFVSACIAGVLIGSFVMAIYKLGLVLIGSLFGFTFAMYILSLKSGGLISSETWRIVFIVLMTVLGGVAIFFLEKIVIILATAFNGSYLVFSGIDYFAKTGFNQALEAFITTKNTYVLTDAVAGMLGGVGALFVIGVLYQFFEKRRYADKS